LGIRIEESFIWRTGEGDEQGGPAAGGVLSSRRKVLFGTDVGYIDQFDTSEEFKWMSRAGMSFQQILASLTTNPAQHFGYTTQSGRIAKGLDADLVVLSADPAQNTSAFSKVRYTIRSGEVIYTEK
jgi:imidazolonepropionase-like amidohydrolase